MNFSRKSINFIDFSFLPVSSYDKNKCWIVKNSSPIQIAGSHFEVYDAYYKSLDPKLMNNIGAMDAAKFLKKSGLSDVVLSRVSFRFIIGFFFHSFSSHWARLWFVCDYHKTFHIFFNAIKGLGLVGSERKRCTRQAWIFRCIEARRTGSNGRTYWREESRDGNECAKVRRCAEDKATASAKNEWCSAAWSSTARRCTSGLVGEGRREAKVCQLVQLDASREWSIARRQGRWLAQGVKVARRNAQSDLGVGGSRQRRQLGWAWIHCGECVTFSRFRAVMRRFAQLSASSSTRWVLRNTYLRFLLFCCWFQAMHLVYKALDRRAIPSTLPKELQKGYLKQEDISGGFVANFEMAGNIVPVAPVIPAPSRPPAPGAAVPALAPPSAGGDWVLSTVEKLKYQELFEKCDLDRDGMVSGAEIKDVFLKSGLQTQLLAHIWALCDTDQSGKLSNEQFQLACWFIDRKKKGIDPPQVLAPEMVPPSMRPGAAGPAKVSWHRF